MNTSTETSTPSSLQVELRRAVLGFLDYLQVECGLANRTREAYANDMRSFAACLDTTDLTRLADMRVVHIEAFLTHCRQKGLASTSTARSLAAVRMFCRYLVLQHKLQRDPSETIEGPKRGRPLPKVMDDETVRKLIASPEETRDVHACRDRAILTLLYATGMRASELTGLKCNDISPKLGIVRVLGKGNKERLVPVASKATQAVMDYAEDYRPLLKRGDSGEWLFLSRTGRQLKREDIYRLVSKYARREGIRGRVSPHTFRHSFATQLISHDADLRSVQDMLGHADIATTQIYTHVNAQRLQAVHKKFHPRG